MFDLLGFSMVDNYEERKVDRFEAGELIVDTVAVTDSEQPFETGISHPGYNGGEWIIVQLYDTKDAAQIGHNRWVKKMTGEKPPAELRDVSSATIAKLCDAAHGEEDWRTHQQT